MRAVVLGVNGQDGSYAAERLLARGYEVLGVGRQAVSRYVPAHPEFSYRPRDLADPVALRRLLQEWPADHLYHYAAVHGPNGPAYEARFGEMMQVNVLSLQAALEHARVAAPGMRILYAGSAKVFGNAAGDIDEETPRATTCLYGNTKNSAFDLIAHYRGRHGIAASNLILFNHESPRRPRGFFVADLAACLAAALRDPDAKASFQTLDFFADWSDAAEFADIAIDLAEGQTQGADVLFASGHTWHAREAVAALFAAHGMDYERHVVEQKPRARPSGYFHADPARLTRLTGRVPAHNFVALVSRMAESIAKSTTDTAS